MAESFDFEEVDGFSVGAPGEPGNRIFLLQALAEGLQVTVKCEKQQVSALAEYLQGVLADLPTVEGQNVPANLELKPPLIPLWSVGMVSVAYDDLADRILIVVEEVPDQESLLEPASLRVRLTLGQVTALVQRADELVEGGRPPCPICGNLKGPDHSCPRTNGHRPPS